MPTPSPSRTNLERELARIWEDVLQCAPIGSQENFFDLGGTSVQAARVFTRIEEVFHKRLPLSLILGAPTIEQLAPSLLPGKCLDRKTYVVPIQSGGEKPALFCVGGGPSWRALAAHLGADQPVFNIGLEPGAVAQTKGPNPLEKLARQMVSALCEKQPQGPYYLCGYCIDGAFAFEMARQLKMYGHEVGLLVLIESRNPSPDFRIRMVNGARRNAMRLAFQVDHLFQLIRKGEISRYLRGRREELERFMLRALLRACPGFQHRVRQSGRLDSQEFLYLEMSFSKLKPLECPTAIFRCQDWPIYAAGDPYFGWRKLLTGRCETHEVPGDHIGILHEPNVAVLAEKLRACLQNTRQAETPGYNVIIDADRRLYLGQSGA